MGGLEVAGEHQDGLRVDDCPRTAFDGSRPVDARAIEPVGRAAATG
ncbi:hypothetical protein [Streptomyces sp. NPDC053542]